MEYGRLTRLVLTRAGLVEQLFYVCYSCSVELSEQQLSTPVGHYCATNERNN